MSHMIVTDRVFLVGGKYHGRVFRTTTTFPRFYVMTRWIIYDLNETFMWAVLSQPLFDVLLILDKVVTRGGKAKKKLLHLGGSYSIGMFDRLRTGKIDRQ